MNELLNCKGAVHFFKRLIGPTEKLIAFRARAYPPYLNKKGRDIDNGYGGHSRTHPSYTTILPILVIFGLR